MKKDCEECVKNDKNHHAEDCLYCMQYHVLLETKADDENTEPFCLNLTIVKLPHPGGD